MECIDTDNLAGFGLYNLDELVFWEKTVNRICVDRCGPEVVIYIYTPSGWHYGLTLYSPKLLKELTELMRKVME